MAGFEHSFLFQEGLWTATGRYYDAGGQPLVCEGETRITHQEDLWVNEGFMRLLTDQPVEFKNRYEIEPLTDGKEVAAYRSANPDLPGIEGRFVIVYDSITSIWQSVNEEFWGGEFMVQAGPTMYHSRGFACRFGKKISSWAVELILVS